MHIDPEMREDATDLAADIAAVIAQYVKKLPACEVLKVIAFLAGRAHAIHTQCKGQHEEGEAILNHFVNAGVEAFYMDEIGDTIGHTKGNA